MHPDTTKENKQMIRLKTEANSGEHAQKVLDSCSTAGDRSRHVPASEGMLLWWGWSYEFMRRSLIFYRNEIQKMTGKDPLEQFGISEEARFQLGGLKA
ncbi:pleckstrin homology [Lynx pardinus]|uniref:Pleckstrin homology n=1 Tax=Lynx pardinus TaxID=191816 RepID=A0A485NX69_LYNPA|nr:pleckstrin homology [Lynx pardinus]